jgi:hypothetical protein
MSAKKLVLVTEQVSTMLAVEAVSLQRVPVSTQA